METCGKEQNYLTCGPSNSFSRMSNEDSSESEVSFTEKSRDEQFEVVINLVRQHKFIYDFEDKDHKDRDKLNKAWNDMGKELGVTGKLCLVVHSFGLKTN